MANKATDSDLALQQAGFLLAVTMTDYLQVIEICYKWLQNLQHIENKPYTNTSFWYFDWYFRV